MMSLDAGVVMEGLDCRMESCTDVMIPLLLVCESACFSHFIIHG